jgi:hypothetical protein
MDIISIQIALWPHTSNGSTPILKSGMCFIYNLPISFADFHFVLFCTLAQINFNMVETKQKKRYFQIFNLTTPVVLRGQTTGRSIQLISGWY